MSDSDLLERVKFSQACMGLIGTITLPAELHHALVDEVERLRLALATLFDTAHDLRSYTHDWDWKYGGAWDKALAEAAEAARKGGE